MMPNECHRAVRRHFCTVSPRACMCVHTYGCAYPPRVHEKGRDTRRERREGRGGRADQNEREREDRQVTESSFTPFDSFAVRDTYALLASSRVFTHACTHARTIFGSSSLRVCVYAGAVRYGRKSFIYSFTTGPKKRGKYRPKEDL